MQQCLREGLPFPERIANAPDLLTGLELYYLAFFELCDSRNVGMTLGPIPWKVIHDYCKAYNLSEEQTEEMHYHIREMDSAYLQHQRKKK
jgi:hypothetical protein